MSKIDEDTQIESYTDKLDKKMKERKEKQESKAEDGNENEKGDDFVLAWQ